MRRGLTTREIRAPISIYMSTIARIEHEPSASYLKTGETIAARLFAIGTVAFLVSAMVAKFDPTHHPRQDYLYGTSFLGMPITAKTLPGWSETTWAHALLDDGLARARKDMSRGEMKYFLYGLTSAESTAQAATRLAAHGIKLELAGCETGTPRHHQDMLYNDHIQSKTSLNAAQILLSSPGNLDTRDTRGRSLHDSDADS